MQITVIFEDEVATLEVGEDMELENLVALVRNEIPPVGLMSNDQLTIMAGIRGIQLQPDALKMTLQQHGIRNNDMLNVVASGVNRETPRVRSRTSSVTLMTQSEIRNRISSLVSQIRVPGKKSQLPQEPADRETELRRMTRRLFDQLSSDPEHVRNYKLSAPQIAASFEANPQDYEHFHKSFVEFDNNQRRLIALTKDENSIEGQKFIADRIRQDLIRQQYEAAMEHSPESYIPINLLHIHIKINGVDVLAMIDSGAQNSIISAHIAKKCNIYDHVDERFHTNARGIGGSSKVRGRIHSCKLQIGNSHIQCPLDVLDDNRVEILLGLTFLRPNGCLIDCKRNILVLNDTETPFLGDEEYKREVKRLGQSGIGMFNDSQENQNSANGEKMEE